MHGAQAVKPCLLVRSKYAERAPALCEHLIELEDHLVFAAHPLDSQLEQAALHRAVALQCRRLVIAVRIDCLYLKPRGERRDLFTRPAMQNNECTPKLAQCGIQFRDRLQDELNSPVMPGWEDFENLRVEHEGAIDSLAA